LIGAITKEMDRKLREAQEEILKVFAKGADDFALAGGTALELYYLKHRFSADLDFFSPRYDSKEISRLAALFNKYGQGRMNLESEFASPGNRAKVKFYTLALRGSERPLKMNFVEDVIFRRPVIRKFSGIRVYDAKHIYLQKLFAVAGTRFEKDDIGRQLSQGSREARAAFDIYMLSKKIQPLHLFLKGAAEQLQRGMVHWYRTFSRLELKLGLLDLEIYDKRFDAKRMIIYLEDEIEQFAEEAIR